MYNKKKSLGRSPSQQFFLFVLLINLHNRSINRKHTKRIIPFHQKFKNFAFVSAGIFMWNECMHTIVSCVCGRVVKLLTEKRKTKKKWNDYFVPFLYRIVRKEITIRIMRWHGMCIVLCIPGYINVCITSLCAFLLI